MITYSRRYNTMQDVLNVIAKCVEEIHKPDCSDEEFDKLTDHIYRLIEKLIFRCLGNVHEARKKLVAEGLGEYLDLYLELHLVS